MPSDAAPATRSTAEPARLGPVEFGRALIASGDLDPIYVMLAGGDLPRPALARWCLAYWCFYHAGVASRAAEAEGAAFWGLLRRADREKWPRGAERRHFRGAASAASLEDLAARFPEPEAAAGGLTGLGSAPAVMAAARAWRGFGPWIAFKVADMVDRVLGTPLDWSGCDLAFYAEPAEGARLAAAELGLPAEAGVVVGYLRDRLAGLKAPPRGDRPLDTPECETILCKYKAHRNGRYPVGKDTREIRHALEGWGPTARRLAARLPPTPTP